MTARHWSGYFRALKSGLKLNVPLDMTYWRVLSIIERCVMCNDGMRMKEATDTKKIYI
jgi:hypothetical protein